MRNQLKRTLLVSTFHPLQSETYRKCVLLRLRLVDQPVFQHATQLQAGEHFWPPLWHSQQFFKQWLFWHLHLVSLPPLPDRVNSIILAIFSCYYVIMVFSHPMQEQSPEHTSPTLQQSQYFFRQWDFQHLQPLLCFTGVSSFLRSCSSRCSIFYILGVCFGSGVSSQSSSSEPTLSDSGSSQCILESCSQWNSFVGGEGLISRQYRFYYFSLGELMSFRSVSGLFFTGVRFRQSSGCIFRLSTNCQFIIQAQQAKRTIQINKYPHIASAKVSALTILYHWDYIRERRMRIEQKYDSLKMASEKGIVKQFKNGQTIYMSCHIFKFNDYKKKQQRNLLVTSLAIYNLKDTDIKRRIEIERVKGISYSKIGTQFVIHIPSEYDYRYASSDLRDRIIYYILKAFFKVTGEKLPIYYRDQLSLVMYAMTKEDKKKLGSKDAKGKYVLHNDESYKQYIVEEEQEKQVVRKTTKTLFAKNFQQEITINDFIPKVMLGKGAFGTVLLVEKKGTKDLFAMKSISKEDVIKKDQLEHTKTEKIILEHVNHPFLVNLVYAFQTPQKLYFIMQFMKGGQLFQHLANAKKFPEKQAKFYAMQIAMGLGHLHDKDFIYRDLKLQNVLMDENGNVCLTDFGMAKIIRDGEMAQTFCGTPEYLAPEVLQGKGYEKSADWWSLGILTYEMLFGLPPFYHNSQKEMFRKIKEGQLRFPEKIKITEQAKDFIIRMLHRDPKQRLGSRGEANQVLSHPWFQDLDRQKMLRKEIKPPFKPKVDGQDWMEGFDMQFTSEKPVCEDKGEASNAQYQKVFKNF